MASDVDISNLALSLLGERAEVISIRPPDGTNEAAQCGRFYPLARDELLEMHAWTFATRRVALASVVNTRPGFRFAYVLPALCLRPLSLLEVSWPDYAVTADFVIETDDSGARLLFTNLEYATLRYIAAVTDTTRFTPLFSAALARLMAVKLAGQLLKGSTGAQMSQAMEKMFLIERAEAVSADSRASQTSTAFRERTPDSIKARMGYGTWYGTGRWGGRY